MIVKKDFEKNFDILQKSRADLENLSIDYILNVFDKLSKLWADKNGEYYKKAIKKLPQITGYSNAMTKDGLEVIINLLKKENILFLIEKSIGNKALIDDFVYSYDKAIYSKFRPLGVVAHISASNVFISCVDSLISGIVTKNANILKMPRGDKFFPVLFLESLKKADEKGVITNSIQLWDFRSKTKEAESVIKQKAQGIVVWGGEEAIESYRKGISLHTRLIEYGPKYSFSIICRDKELEKVALNSARDVIMWEQMACSSPHVIFVNKKFYKNFAHLLHMNLEKLNKTYPKPELDFNEQTEVIKFQKLEETACAFENGEILNSDNHSVIVKDTPCFENTCMNRNVFVKAFEKEEEIIKNVENIGRFVQTVGIWADRDKFFKLSSTLSKFGAYKFTAPGYMFQGKNGAPHDGEFPLRKLGEFISIENLGLDPFSEIVEFAKDNTEFYKNREQNALLTRKECFENSPPFSKSMITGDDFNGFIFSSGGTTGKPKYALYSREDYEIMTDILEKIYREAGINENDRVANIFIAGNLWTSFLVANEALRKIGCTNYPIAGNSDFEVIDLYLERFKINAIVGLPSIIIKMAEICEENNLDIKIDKILYGGEHFYKSAREYLKKVWGVKRIASAGYALVDTGPVGYQCKYQTGGVHHLCDNYVHLEIIDDEGNFITEYDKTGEMIITNINRFKMPVIRFKSGDAGRFIKTECPCGFRGVTFELLGRCDDVVIAGSTNLEFISFEETISEFEGLSSIWQIIITTENSKDKVTWKIEKRNNSGPIKKEDVFEVLKKHSKNIKSTYESGWLDVNIEIVPSGSIERVERTGKIKKIVDKRIT
ncbi:MAG: aldehyde dehydrogenase family protein [Candidatus Muiribacteriota bacterium]